MRIRSPPSATSDIACLGLERTRVADRRWITYHWGGMDDLRINTRVVVAARWLSWTAARASGPGGQNVNKVNSKVWLTYDLRGCDALPRDAKSRLRQQARGRIDQEGRISISSQKTRDQSRNLVDARARLKALIEAALVRPKARRATKPSRGAKRRRLEAKRQTKEKKAKRGRVDWD